MRRENRGTRGKTSQSKEEPTHVWRRGKNWTQDKLVEGDRVLSSLRNPALKKKIANRLHISSQAGQADEVKTIASYK